MTDKNTQIWDSLRTPPKDALKKIQGGRLKGMTDISPQWRYQVMTEQFGPCGVGWKYEIKKLYTEEGSEGQIAAFAVVDLFIKVGEVWSEPIPGIGGNMFVANEKGGKHTSDECFKMAVTDAMSVAMKMIGVGADIYSGKMDGSKYSQPPQPETNTPYWTKDDKKQFAELKGEVDKCATPEDVDMWIEEKRSEGIKVKDFVKSDLMKYCGEIKEILSKTVGE